MTFVYKFLLYWDIVNDSCARRHGPLVSLHQETICDANAERKLQNFVSKSGSSPQMHARWQHQIPMLRVGGWGFAEFDVEFKFAKIQNSYVEGFFFFFAEFDVEFKFAKIQNSYVEGGWVGGLLNLMLSSNLLKSKIPMLRVGGCIRGVWGGFTEFDVELKFAIIQNSYVEEGVFFLGGVAEFDVEFKFAKIQNSYVEGGGFTEFDVEFKFAKIQSFHFHEPPPPRKWKFQFRTGLRKLFEVDF